MSTFTPDEPLPSLVKRFSSSPNRDPDAGLQALRYYERKLPPWRYKLRTWLIPVIRWETSFLVRMQTICRSQLLDTYFAFTANLGTHTFFMTFLPICFWCGYPDIGIALVHMLALGVYLSGVVKDLVCLPRPLSPPLQRITMSGSAALEYGFPSTHTTNAVSVAVFALHQLWLFQDNWSTRGYNIMRIACYCYATSITIGRMYCGMHGLFDVIIGALLGAAIAWFRVAFGQAFDVWIIEGIWSRPALSVAVLALAIRFHPEPADNCPCFDDSVAFLGVVMGIEIGTWHYFQSSGGSTNAGASLADLYAYTNQDLVKAALRLVGGIAMIFVWRAIMKPFLLRTLPPTFRFVDHWGVNMPRRYFLQAKDYTNVPPLPRDDNVIPSALDIPAMLSTLSHPRRRRISVGPQSEADAREFFASREQKRQDDRSASRSRRMPGIGDLREHVASTETGRCTIKPNGPDAAAANGFLTEPGSNTPLVAPTEGPERKTDRDLISALEKPRTHYDVEVITKLIVYAGIAWLAVEGNPILFKVCGLA